MDNQASVVRREVVAAQPSEAMAALLDIDLPHSDEVPELWHWIYLLERRRSGDLGYDGHPTSGIPAPPGPGRRRMFAGGRVVTHRRLRFGEEATRVTTLLNRHEKDGRTGPLTFVTVLHEISQSGSPCITEEQDIVYRTPGNDALPSSATPHTHPIPTDRPRIDLPVDERLLFRFSALTYNAHRIHYDFPFARSEGYDGLVIHGPLQALMLGELTRRHGQGLMEREFSYRLVAPLTTPQTLTVIADDDGVDEGGRACGENGTTTAISAVSALRRG